MVAVDVKNPIEVRRAGIQALNDTLGPEGARAFMLLNLRRTGDFTAEKYERPQESFDEYTARLLRLEAEKKVRNAGAA
jgi:hypothetical protein